ncbi:unnamed protein product [Rhizoctonia solani]|uniref:Uncharacterized protein n=1 Tax=Rhizoctonia solani TaxID=456999 RepID=A0A8H3A026_9AGAM|nr:unnamed protein product [Rhizoctonia solani]
MARCPVHRAPAAPPLVQNGEVNFQARHVGYIVAGLFTLASIIASAWLVQKHLKWYSCKPQQRHIVRLLFMVPIYAIITLASYLSLSNATSLLLIRDAYESVVLASFFSLLLEYLAGPAHPPPEHPPKSKKRRKNARDEEQERLDTESTFPTGTESIAHPLTKAERATIVHKVFYRVPMYPLKLTSQLNISLPDLLYPRTLDQKCVWNTAQSQVVTIVSVSVTVAMYCLIQLYTTISKELKPYSPLLKLFAVKAVVFLTFWQSALLSGLASLDIIKDTEYMTAEDIVVGFSALLQTFEMMCFALLHVKAFSYVPYKRIARIRTETRSSPTPERSRARDPDMPPLLTPPNEERAGSRPDRPVPAPPKQQLINLFQAFTFTDTFRDLRAGVLYFFGRGASREADDVCRREERFREVFGRERVQRSFMKVSGYKGLPQDEGRAIPGVQYSPLPTPPKEDYDDAPQLSLSKTRESEDTVRDGQLEYLVQRLDYGYSPRAPDPPPRGAYVPKHGPGPSIAWSGDGVITPPLTPGVVSPGRSRSPRAAGVGSPLQIPGVSFPPYAPGGSSPIYSPGRTSQRQTPGVGTSSYASPAPVSPVKAPSRRIGDVYVGGTRGVEFVSQPRPMGVYASPRPEGTTTPRLGESPTSPLSAGPRLPPRLEGAYISPRPEAVHAPPSGGARAQRDRSQSLPLPRTAGTHISPDSAQMLAQASPLFQQSFTTEARANYPLSPVSPPAQRGRGDLAPPRASGETRRTSGCGGPSQRNSAYEACSPRTSGHVDPSQRYSGFTIPQWASVTPTHSQWPTDTTAPTRRTSGVTTDPPSPTRGRRMSITEEEEPPSREDSMLARMFSGATRTTESRARDSESAGARTSMTSFRIGDNVSSTTGSDVGVNDSVSVQPVRTVSFRTGAPTLIGEIRPRPQAQHLPSDLLPLPPGHIFPRLQR